MTHPLPASAVSLPPGPLAFDKVTLRLVERVAAVPDRGYVPYYHFRILNNTGEDVGHINFRVGDTPHVRNFAGHIGFAICEPHRGHCYALQACRAIAPFVQRFYDAVTLTCDPENLASRRTIERLGATFVDDVLAPIDDTLNQQDVRRKVRFCWRF